MSKLDTVSKIEDPAARAEAAAALLRRREAAVEAELAAIREVRDAAVHAMLAAGRRPAEAARAIGVTRSAITNRFGKKPAKLAAVVAEPALATAAG